MCRHSAARRAIGGSDETPDGIPKVLQQSKGVVQNFLSVGLRGMQLVLTEPKEWRWDRTCCLR